MDLPEFLMTLGEPFGWDRLKYESNRDLQDEFFDQLHINTYHEFKDVLFWDVLLGLTKLYIVNHELDILEENEDIWTLSPSSGKNLDNSQIGKNPLSKGLTIRRRKTLSM